MAEFGSAVEAELKKIDAKTQKEAEVKSQRLLAKWLDLPVRYRDPIRSGHVPVQVKDGND